ncbi:MAG: molybdenum cofactor guanylyltransferase [Actinomycetota bacterium]|jgi:molybdopterin-guanine dinucleotide biosynthesis protein A|nr:molybdenum cofactor guanylyltransferase [Rubrobacteraceae bacterium]MBA3634890.1 molybdenum cofactor guanylyltransferase [Rubrobacteraceae bacterium]MDQ3183276.1 molybdenum cofactor guanylyltransferase [Actinomycetota bacterium]MDQ3499290.1 molybdenum cofactor guanylyltransferase [Actinomycetota bacterium]
MGREKLSLEVEGMPLIERVRDALAGCCHEVLVVGDGGARLEGVRHVTGERPGGLGPLAGMEAGLASARHPLTFVAAGDMPFLTRSMVDYLLERLDRSGVLAVVPRYRGRTHPLCAAYARALLPRLETDLDGGARAVQGFLEGVDKVDYVEVELRRFGDPSLLLVNVNSPEDLEWARRGARR